METLKKHALADTKDVAIILDDTLVANCCGAILKKFYSLANSKTNLRFLSAMNVTIDDFENVSHVYVIDCSIPEAVNMFITAHDAYYVVDVFNTSRYKAPHVCGDVHISSTKYRVCSTLWEYLFNKTTLATVPNCVRYIDEYTAEANCSERAVHYCMGMELMETNPETSFDFWDALFDSRENLPPSATEEEVMERMKWDTMLQVINMGAIVETYLSLTTEVACENALVHGEVCFLNIRNYAPRALFEASNGSTFVVPFYAHHVDKDSGEYIFKYTVCAKKSNASALIFANKFGGSGTRTKATFYSPLTPEKIWEQLSCKTLQNSQ